MPPEPLPWERFKDRRYDRPPPDGPGSGPRWREPMPHNVFRGRLPGNGRSGPWRYHSSESGRGFTPSRANDKFIGDEGFSPSGYRMDGRYNRFNRDNNKAPFTHRDNMRGQHSWENDMSPNSSSRPYFGNDQRSDDDRGSFLPKDLRGNCWENGRVQSGSDQRALDEKGAFGRREMRGKYWKNGSVECSADDKVPFEKKDLKRRSPENGVLPNGFGRSHILNDQRPVDDKGQSSGQKNLREKSCENGPYQSSMDDKDIKEHSVENGVVPNCTNGVHIGSERIPLDDMPTFTSPTYSDHSKDQCDKSSGANDVVLGRKLENENSLVSIDWKPLKWSRSGSLSSRGSGFSSCMKSPDSAEQKTEMPPYSATPLRSPSGDAVTFATFSSEEGGSRKKPRLGWGEGLAKFEKKKVEGPDDDSATKPGLVVCVSGEPSQVSDKSPKVAGLLECASPATPSSIACFSPGVEDKACVRSANIDYDTKYSSGSPNKLLQENTEGSQERDLYLENGDHASLANISSSLTELVHLEDPATVESNFVISTAMNKLLVLRGETLKALEATESEIDSLENDLKKLIPLNGGCQAKPCEDVEKISRNLEISASKDVEPLGKMEDIIDVEVEENLEEGQICVFDDGNTKSHSIAVLASERAAAVCDQILASNKDTAIRASEEFSKLMPSNYDSNHGLEISSVSSWKDSPRIMEKFKFKKRCKRFEERVNIFKYKALQHFWKEDLQSTSLKKNNPKSHRRLELSSRGLYGSNKKHRSLRSRISNAAGNLNLSRVPTAGAISSASKLLSDLQVKPYRNSLKMPALIMDKKERITTRFISSNSLVEDPCAVEKERKMINPWTKEEKDIYMDKFTSFRKDFNKISSFLENKTTADCVEFYYKNHKSDCFVKLKKKPDLSKEGKSCSFNNYLVGSGKRWDRETNAASLDVLGEASEIAAKADNAMKNRQESNSKSPKIDDFDVSVNERETEAADVLAGICGSISSEAMGSCITSSFDRGERNLPNQRVGSDNDSYSDDSCGEIEPNNWTDEERAILVGAVASHGIDFSMISRRVETKTKDQCKVFFSKIRKCLGLDMVRPRACGEGQDDDNGGGSDIEGCLCALDSAVSSEKSSSKSDKDVMLSSIDMHNLGKNECKEIVESVSSDKSSSKVGNNKSENNCKDLDESEKTIVDDLAEESRLAMNLEAEGDIENGADNDPSIMQNIEEGGAIGESLSPIESVSAGVTQAEEQEVVLESTLNEKENKNNLNDKQKEIINGLRDLNRVQAMVSENSLYEKEDEKNLKAKHKETGNCVQDLNHVQDLNSETLSNIDFGVDVEQEPKISIDLNPPLEPLDISLEVDSRPVKGTSMSEAIPSSSKSNFEISAEKLYTKSTSVDSKVFVGYPLQVAVNRETNGDYHERLRHKYSGSDSPSTPSSGPEFPFRSYEQMKSHLRHHSWSSSSDTEKPKGNGDVKLFGQILTPQPKESRNSSTSENINQKASGANTIDSDLGKVDRDNYIGLENVPTRSFGLWDGNRVAVGFPSLPDSAILLAKYPAAFGNFSSTTENYQTVVQSSNNDINLNGVSVFPSNGSNGVVDYQLYMNQQGLISEMQRKNGINNFPSLRNPIGVVGANVGISDPVAAIKMHYAKKEKFEGESWRGKADLGR